MSETTPVTAPVPPEQARDGRTPEQQQIDQERGWIARGLCPWNGKPIMPNGILRPACSICDCGE